MSNAQNLIGLIGWGGLVLNKEKELADLQLSPWRSVGPILPLEFSHIAPDHSLQLVIDHNNGEKNQTQFCTTAASHNIQSFFEFMTKVFGFTSTNKSIKSGTPNTFFGYFKDDENYSSWSHQETLNIIKEWKKKNWQNVEIVFWLDLSPNFDSFTTKSALTYIFNSKNERKDIADIFSTCIQTPFRRLLEKRYLGDTYSNVPGKIQNHFNSAVRTAHLESVKYLLNRRTYMGKNQNVEYVCGNIPIVLSAPHGGHSKPKEIPDRKNGVLESDDHSFELACEIFTGSRFSFTPDVPRVPHLVVLNLHRVKLDGNRNMQDAAEGNPIAEDAWIDYHNFIEIAKSRSVHKFGFAHYFDIHGNSSSTKVMIGQLIRKADFEQNMDHILSKLLTFSSLRSLAYSKNSIDEQFNLLLGEKSIGGLLQKQGFECTPVGKHPFDWGGDFFNGGYNTFRHSSTRNNGKVNATQIETPISIRANMQIIRKFSDAFAISVWEFMKEHYSLDLKEVPLKKK